MLKEWTNSILEYLAKTKDVLSKNVNGQPFPLWTRWLSAILLFIVSAIIVFCIPSGFGGTDFIDYIKDILAIFVGFFVTVLTFVFDKLDITPLPTQDEIDQMPADKRPTAQQKLKIKREHNYTIRFFYTIGLTIIISTIELALLIPNIFWANWFDVDIRQYQFVKSFDELSNTSVCLFFHLISCAIYRFIIVAFTISVFFYVSYCVSSLLQVLISKKKMETWN